MYATNNLSPPELPSFKSLPRFASWLLTVLFLVILAVCSAIFLIVYSVSDKKAHGQTNLGLLNIKQQPRSLLKILLAGVIVIAVAYGSLTVLQYLFNEDYRWWMASFSEMKMCIRDRHQGAAGPVA